jgi:hypothetical protein
LFARFAIGDLEAAHGRAALLDVVGRGGTVLALDFNEIDAGGADLLIQCASFEVENRAGGILRVDSIVDECIEQELLAPDRYWSAPQAQKTPDFSWESGLCQEV